MNENNQREPSDATSNEHRAAAAKATDRRFPRFVDFLVLLGIFFVAQFIGAVVAMVLGCHMPDTEAFHSIDEAVRAEEMLNIGRFNAISYIVAMGLTILGTLIYRNVRHCKARLARFSLRGFNPILILWGVAFIVAVQVVAEPLFSLLPAVPDIYGRGFAAMLTIVIIAPIAEEFLCRGIILEAVWAKRGVVWAWLISALFFGVMHVHPTLVVNAFIIGLILGYIYIRSESLYATIILHILNNAGAYVVMLITGSTNESLSDYIASPMWYTVVYVAACGVFAASGYMLFRELKKLKMTEKIQL